MSEILIGSHHVGDKPVFFGLFREGADHIIGFVSVDKQCGDVESFNQFMDVRQRFDDIFGRLLAVGLVGLKTHLPHGGGHGVEGHPDVCGLFPLQQIK